MEQTRERPKKDTIEGEYNSAELPAVSISKTITIGDNCFEKEKIEISSRGWNMKEAIAGFQYLLKAKKKLEK
ncbi:MAG: hypothetical protein QGH34_03280 [Candidatus Woesearchaeota archaeon]|nr:hypothetical protein [Candidatus Woesearchaeota archaeon]|tara:strand:+ start:280 stop:495 length:216 start_codon:yes stop_codon:yes gene_type:complete